jgi:hypothetical protein
VHRQYSQSCSEGAQHETQEGYAYFEKSVPGYRQFTKQISAQNPDKGHDSLFIHH